MISLAFRHYAITAGLALIFLGCDPLPQEVYVPAGPHRVDIAVSVSKTTVPVVEAITLHATRVNTGDWEKVNRYALDDGMLDRPPSSRHGERGG